MKLTGRLRIVLVPASTVLLLLVPSPADAGEKRKLDGPVVIDGVPCHRTAWIDDAERLESCFLSRDAEVGGQPLPAGTWIHVDGDGRPECVFLPDHTRIQGHVWKGRGHGYQTCFHPNGQLRFANLAEPEEIEGIPCQRSTFLIWIFVGNAGVTFHENGRLRGCLLSRDLELQGRSFRRGQRVALDPEGRPLDPEDGPR